MITIKSNFFKWKPKSLKSGGVRRILEKRSEFSCVIQHVYYHAAAYWLSYWQNSTALTQHVSR